MRNIKSGHKRKRHGASSPKYSTPRASFLKRFQCRPPKSRFQNARIPRDLLQLMSFGPNCYRSDINGWMIGSHPPPCGRNVILARFYGAFWDLAPARVLSLTGAIADSEILPTSVKCIMLCNRHGAIGGLLHLLQCRKENVAGQQR